MSQAFPFFHSRRPLALISSFPFSSALQRDLLSPAPESKRKRQLLLFHLPLQARKRWRRADLFSFSCSPFVSATRKKRSDASFFPFFDCLLLGEVGRGGRDSSTAPKRESRPFPATSRSFPFLLSFSFSWGDMRQPLLGVPPVDA